MQEQQNGMAGLGALRTTPQRKNVNRHPTATVLTLVRESPGVVASKSLPKELNRVMRPEAGWGPPPLTETFVGSVEAARAKARQVINEPAAPRYVRVVEGWQQLADGQIQFTIRTLSR